MQIAIFDLASGCELSGCVVISIEAFEGLGIKVLRTSNTFFIPQVSLSPVQAFEQVVTGSP